jgi:hypothetical protein
MIGSERWGGETVWSSVMKGRRFRGLLRGLRRGEQHVGEAVPYDRIEKGPDGNPWVYKRTLSPWKASVFASCTYIRAQSEGLWRVYCRASDWGVLGPGILRNPTNIESETDHSCSVIGSCLD